jgi:hypothetical protein
MTVHDLMHHDGEGVQDGTALQDDTRLETLGWVTCHAYLLGRAVKLTSLVIARSSSDPSQGSRPLVLPFLSCETTLTLQYIQ